MRQFYTLCFQINTFITCFTALHKNIKRKYISFAENTGTIIQKPMEEIVGKKSLILNHAKLCTMLRKPVEWSYSIMKKVGIRDINLLSNILTDSRENRTESFYPKFINYGDGTLSNR